MKKFLSHLPVHKRAELRAIAKVICETIPTHMVILFGSYARGSWVEDVYTEGHTTYEYKSDYDILVVPKDPRDAYRRGTEDKFESQIAKAHASKTWVNIILHDIDFLNNKIEFGEYFFADIYKQGIMLFDSGETKLAKPRKLSSEERKKVAIEDYKMWINNEADFFDNFKFKLSKNRYKNAAFQLHQATEALYSTILLVYTHYKPKIHDLEKLGKQVNALEPAFLKVIPNSTPEEKRLFDLLKKAYIDARYKKGYKITKKELEYLGDKVKKLERLTRKKCKEKIESFG